ncbi:MAG TPA: peroxidase [Candidatus Binatia bacterium]|nr:peroxidase [Candidatus Binatia bacterium]
MDKTPVDYPDVQGILRFGYGHLPEACFLLLEIDNPGATRRWLKDVKVTTAEELPEPPITALQIALTREGFEALELPKALIAQFSNEFVSGMAGEESRSRRLGDLGVNAPESWSWGSPGKVPHVLLMLYARDGALDIFRESIASSLPAAGLRQVTCLACSFLDGKEPFGFVDGINQPKLDWDRRQEADTFDQPFYSNEAALGEFVLGYPNEYGKYTDHPLLAAQDDPWAELWRAEDQPTMRDFGRNGSYLVLRHLHQRVHTFWSFLDRQADGDPAQRKLLAEAMVGRRMHGEALAPLSREPIPGVGPKPHDIAYNQFTYDSDFFGERCPVGAHIRRANPRNADLPGQPAGFLARLGRILGFKSAHIAEDLVAATRFHRILRRGRKYGSTMEAEQAINNSQADNEERGIYFIGLVANISRQFEFVQNAWMISAKFAGFAAESDPLLGHRAPVPGCPASDGFSIPQTEGLSRRITGLPQFVTTRGGAYFFLPSIRALRYISRIGL